MEASRTVSPDQDSCDSDVSNGLSQPVIIKMESMEAAAIGYNGQGLGTEDEPVTFDEEEQEEFKMEMASSLTEKKLQMTGKGQQKRFFCCAYCDYISKWNLRDVEMHIAGTTCAISGRIHSAGRFR